MAMEGRSAKVQEQVRVPGHDDKFRELIVYISAKGQDDPWFGRIKLNKILFYSDFRSFRRRGQPITGVAYRRLPQGPAPKNLVPVLNELHRDGSVTTQVRLVGGKEQKRPIALRSPNLKFFSGEEIAIVDEVISELLGKSATVVSNESHGIQWNTRNHMDPMPYESALLSDDQTTADDVYRAKELIAELKISFK